MKPQCNYHHLDFFIVCGFVPLALATFVSIILFQYVDDIEFTSICAKSKTRLKSILNTLPVQVIEKTWAKIFTGNAN